MNMGRNVRKRTLVVIVPATMYKFYQESAVKEGKTISEITRKLIAGFINRDLSVKMDLPEYKW